MAELSRVTLATGVELDVWDQGPRDAPAIIFLHGFPENHHTWRHQVEHFSDRFRCIAPDQRGYGNSARPEGVENYSVDKLVGDIFALAEALEISEFTIAGHDWGGAIAWLVAIFGQAQGKVSRAVIANAPHPLVFQNLLFTDEAQRAASQYMRAFRDPANDALVHEGGLAPLLMQALSHTTPPPHDPEERAILFEQWSDPDRAFAMLNWYRASTVTVPALDEPYGVPPTAEPLDLPAIQIPTLVIWGMGDEALLPANLELDEQVSDLTIERVEGSGHFVPWEAPEAVNAAMERFLAR